jgi:hypothetical protein
VHAFTPYKVVGQHGLVGQFHPADGLALLSGRKLGPSDFLPLASLRWSGAVLSFDAMQAFEEKPESSGPAIRWPRRL